MQLNSEICERILDQTRISSAFEILVNEFEKRKSTMTIIQVGACDHIQDVVKGKEFIRAHLIEAVDWLCDDLVEAMEPYKGHVKCYNAAISNKDEIRNFYSAARQAGIDEPERPEWQLFQIGSLLKSNLSPYFPEQYIESG